jgi:hypothetical protein
VSRIIFTQAAGALQLSLGLIFALSVAPKLRRPRSFAGDVEDYHLLPRRASLAAALLLIGAELALALALLAGILTRLAIPLALGLLGIFLVAVAVNLRRGRSVACGCFGRAEERISGMSIARLLLLSAAAAALLLLRAGGYGRDAGLTSLGAVPLTDQLATWLLAVALLLLGSWTLRLPEIVAMTHTSQEGTT